MTLHKGIIQRLEAIESFQDDKADSLLVITGSELFLSLLHGAGVVEVDKDGGKTSCSDLS